MLNKMSNMKYKDFGEIFDYSRVETEVNKFLNANPGIEVVMFERLGGNGIWGAHMFYKLPEGESK
jgi:hypothetical protein